MKPPAQPAPPPITPEQLRDARAALGWSSNHLAIRTGVSPYSIIKYERFGRLVVKRGQPRNFDALTSIRAALEAAGVEFITEDSGGPSARLAKPMTEADFSRLTPAQVRTARAILGWSRETLSFASLVTVHFICVYEEFGRVGRLNLRRHDFDGLIAIRIALEAAGVEFIEENGSELEIRMRSPNT